MTGAADGYYRMADKPAATLLHLGPGLANGLANIHNANKARRSGMVNIVGDHATYHRQYDAPLTSDIEGLARPFSHWVKTSPDADADRRRRRAGDRGRAAAARADRDPDPAGRHRVERGLAGRARCRRPRAPPRRRAMRSREAARVLRSGEPTLILLTGRAVRERRAGARRHGSPPRPARG